MRISVRDQDYVPKQPDGWKVLLDGVEVKHCETADEEGGYVVVAVVDAKGHLVIDGDEVRMEKKYGKVEIVR